MSSIPLNQVKEETLLYLEQAMGMPRSSGVFLSKVVDVVLRRIHTQTMAVVRYGAPKRFCLDETDARLFTARRTMDPFLLVSMNPGDVHLDVPTSLGDPQLFSAMSAPVKLLLV